MASGIEEILTTLYEMVQDAWSLPLGADKCVLERDKVLDLLDEISNQLPGFGALHGIVDIVVRDLTQLLDLGLRVLHEVVSLLLGLQIDLLVRDHLPGALLGLLENVFGLALGVGDDVVAGFHDRLGLLELTGKLVADLIEKIEDLVAFEHALVCAERKAPRILHHLV